MNNSNYEIRIGTCGQVDTGKSTLLSILSNPNNIQQVTDLDDGRGKARARIFKHKHEKETGRTSSITHCYTIYNGKRYTFLDLAGHEKYLRTTMSGISGGVLDYVIILLGANTGNIPKITKEHISLALAFKLPIIFVVTKIDMNVNEQKLETINKLKKLMISKGAGNKEIIEIKDKENIYQVIDNIKNKNHKKLPLFQVSNTTGENIDLLIHFLSKLEPNNNWENEIKMEPLFLIEEVFQISGIGIVIYGTLKKGIIQLNEQLLLGPFKGKYKKIIIKSIHNNDREHVKELKAGQSGCFWIKTINSKDKLIKKQIKRSMVLINEIKCTQEFDANIMVLHNPTTIKKKYQPVIHCGNIKQSAEICAIIDKETQQQKEILRAGDKAIIKFRFLFHPEFIENNSLLIFREGKTKGIGKIVSL